MNKLSQQELWEKIQNFNLDDQNSSYPFSQKLATQNNWSIPFTHKAIEEYKRFIFLCCISPGGASPSPVVDEVWHLHLTYTQNYWTNFCKNTLQQDVHHHPSKGGIAEKEKHDLWYTQTLRLYKTVFNAEPPDDIWIPAPDEEAEINEAVYDRKFFTRTVIFFVIGVICFAAGINLFHTKGPDFLLYYGLIGVAGLAAIWFTQKNKAERLKQTVLSNLPKVYSVYQITRYLHGPHRSYQTALIDLLQRGIIETIPSGYKIVALPPAIEPKEKNPLLGALILRYKNTEAFTYLEGMGLADSDDLKHPAFERLILLANKIDYYKFIIPGLVLVLGTARLLQGISNHKPVSFLIAEMACFSIISLLMLEMHSYTKYVKDIVQDFWDRQNQEGRSNDVLNNFSVLGIAAITGFAEYAFLSSEFDYYMPKEQRWTGESWSSSSSCSGGGGCGSGCGGGCGGCGG